MVHGKENAMNGLFRELLCAMLLGALIGNAISNWSRDTTDNPENMKRSGLGLYTDHRTGCQYLGTLFGGLTPRLYADGTHVCEGE